MRRNALGQTLAVGLLESAPLPWNGKDRFDCSILWPDRADMNDDAEFALDHEPGTNADLTVWRSSVQIDAVILNKSSDSALQSPGI